MGFSTAQRPRSTTSTRDVMKKNICIVAGLIWSAAVILTGCQTPGTFRTHVDQEAQRIINVKQVQVLGKKTDFSLEKPSDILRRQILEQSSLPLPAPPLWVRINCCLWHIGLKRVIRLRLLPRNRLPMDLNTRSHFYCKSPSNRCPGIILIL